jgi:HEAT repeat protein
MRRAAVRRKVTAVVEGKRQRLSLDVNERGLDVVAVVSHMTAHLRSESPEMLRLVAALQQTGATDGLIEDLASTNPRRQAQSARMLGTLRIEPAVPWLTPLLASPETMVSEAAARALGKIGGARSAEALLGGMQRSGPRRVFIVALARAAPDLFLEVALASNHRPGVLQGVALAAGLRRRQASVRPLVELVLWGSRRERAASCRALGWMGAETAVPVIVGALGDRDWRVRVSAAKTLAVLHAHLYFAEIDALRRDRDPHVRKAARWAARRLWKSLPRSEGWWTWR